MGYSIRRASWVAPAAALILAGAIVVAGCGNDQGEKAASFRVDVARASFPARQHVAASTDLVLAVTNAGSQTIPQLVFTITTATGDAAAATAPGPFDVEVDAQSEPIWLVGPDYPKLLRGVVTGAAAGAAPSAGAVTAQTATYTFGALAPKQSRTAVWRVTPVRAGRYTVRYALAAGLDGRDKAVTARGRPVEGRFSVSIDASPRGLCVVASGRRHCG